MYTIIITTIVLAVVSAIVFKKLKVSSKWCCIIGFMMASVEIGAIVASFISPRYEISKCDVYYISDDKPINIQTSSKEITFFAEEVDGKPISMDIKVDSLSIEHTSDKNSIEVITYVRTNKFAIGGPKVKANVLMSSNPHQ